MINFLLENWAFLVLGVAAIFAISFAIMEFVGKPSSEQKRQVREWLLYMVIQAEKHFGSGTGALKLSYVYDTFISKFPNISKIMPFETFKVLVDEALDKMKSLLTNNKAIREYITDQQNNTTLGEE